MTYDPEDDGGLRIRGRSFMGANLWIPKERVSNVHVLMRACTFYKENNRTGQSEKINLAELTEYHVVIPRYLLKVASSKDNPLQQAEAPDYQWERIDFGSKITPRNPAQQKAWDALSEQDYGTLNLACGKGKTVMALHKIAQRGVPAIVIVPSVGLMEQWQERAVQFLNLTKDQIGIVQGKKAQWDKPLVIAMVHTLSARRDEVPLEARQRFGTVVFDEAHHMSAASFIRTADLFHGARFGLTATPKREDGLEDVYFAHIGPIFYSDLVGELSAEIFFRKIPTELTKQEKERDILDKAGEFSVGKLYQVLANKASRNKHLMDMVGQALGKGRKILVLVHAAVHPKILLDNFNQTELKNRYTATAVSGTTKGPDRTRLMAEADVTFATFGVAKEGLDVASLDTLVFATPFKAWGAFQQGKGRIERPTPNKKDPMVIVLDDTTIGPAAAMCNSLRRLIRANGYKYRNIG